MLVHSRRVCFANIQIRLIQYRLVYPSVVCISRFYSLLSISRWSHDGELILILIYFYVLGIASWLWFTHDLFTFVFISLNIQFFEKHLYSFLYCINNIIVIIIINISIIFFISILIVIFFYYYLQYLFSALFN